MPGPFNFNQYGTFTGPAKNYEFNDDDATWWSDIPIDTSFKLNDIGVLFFNNQSDYAYFHLYGVSTALVTFEKNSGDLPNLLANIQNTIFNGNIIINGTTVANDNIVCNSNVACNGVLNLSGVGNAASYMTTTRAIAQSKKSFDIPHPLKDDHRLRYVCLEGPAAEVYIRGKLENENIITLPEYWSNLIDQETIGVTLTPIGYHQELFVEKIEWGSRIIVKNNSGGSVNCYYTITAERKDTPKNIPEYIGLTPEDYPGDNSEYTINGNWKNK